MKMMLILPQDLVVQKMSEHPKTKLFSKLSVYIFAVVGDNGIQ